MNKLLVLMLLILSLPVSAKSLPPILNFLPSCAPIIVDGIYIEKKLTDSANNKLIASSFQLIREKAKEKRVDAIIITNLIQTDKLIITADLIDFCDDDESLSSMSTAYNQLSRRPITFERSVTPSQKKPATSITIPKPEPEPELAIARVQPEQAVQAPTRTVNTARAGTSSKNFKPALMTQLELAKLAAKANEAGKLSTNITLSGAYGININNSTEYVLNILGPASAVFTLSADTTAWLYGRDLWLIIENDKVQKITYKEHSLLNYTGKNFILYDEDFDNNWLIDDKAGFRDDVPNVRAKLNYLKQKSKAEYTVSNQKNLLKLDFSEFSSYNGKEPDLLLSGFTFYSRDYDRDENQIQYSDIDNNLLNNLLVPVSKPKPLKIQDLVTHYVPNVINYSDDGSWEVLSKHIQVKHVDNTIKQIKLSESINYPVESDEDFMRFLKQMNIPETKQAMMDKYASSATFWLEKMTVTNNDYEIRAEFTTEDDDAMLISLEVEYL
ncbi:hypothetical protein [Shewanella sp. HL-SH2]|uniref:hypothetical protein n=1 Tax=Shewanella sp. HL-SH2 TaxID=3436238 RepID=UPI003EBFA095